MDYKVVNTNASLKRKLNLIYSINPMLDLLKTYLPNFITAINNDRSVLDKVRRFEKRYEGLTLKLAKDGDSNVKPHSIYEWIVEAKSGNPKSTAFLKFLDSVLVFCLHEADANIRPKIKTICFNLITAFDTDVSLNDNPRYLTYVGELLTIHRILSNKSKFQLLDVELEMPNGKKADIFILDRQNGRKLAFDVISIIGFEPNTPENEMDVVKYFHGRFDQKLTAKLKSLPHDELLISINGEKIQFAILPILWNEVFDLKKWKYILSSQNIQYPGVLPLSILLAQQADDETFSFLFSTVDQALETI